LELKDVYIIFHICILLVLSSAMQVHRYEYMVSEF
jgi:hypothetical protein